MAILTQLLETESVKHNYAQNKELYDAIDEASGNLDKVLTSFVIANMNEFISPTLEGFIKNVKTFSSFATQQALVEMTSIVNNLIYSEDAVMENSGASEYI